MLRFLTRIARELNWARHAWSSAGDRRFHDELYKGDHYDPYSWAYPGYTTIRRFADLVEPLLPGSGSAVDLGCGPGEITCELAARRPELTFLGIDHSAAAIDKARANADRRGVANVTFVCEDVERYVPGQPIDLVTLFDSFHHLTTPRAFVDRVGPHVKRWALIEPRGSWAGAWQKDIDLDWVAHDLDKIRARVADATGEAGLSRRSAGGAKAEAPDLSRRSAGGAKAEAVERRYTLDDFRRFFSGYALDLRGTIAGLESYPPGAPLPGQLREQFGEVRYELFRAIDDWLFARNLDLHAKHWLIVAERGGRARRVNDTDLSPPLDAASSGIHSGAAAIVGQYDIQYGAYRGPVDAAPGQRIIGRIELTNRGWDTWSSDGHIFTSYHWLDRAGHIVELDGERTPLPRPVRAGETCDASIVIAAPGKPGDYQLAIDLVREGVTWFSEAGHPWLAVPFRVRKAR